MTPLDALVERLDRQAFLIKSVSEGSPSSQQMLLEEAAAMLRRLQALAKFGAKVLEESRDSLADLDGGWLQDQAQELGLLEAVNVNEPCGENCNCAEYGDFPQECIRYSQTCTDALRDCVVKI